MTDVETEKENSTQKYFFHKIYDKYLNLNQIFNRKKVFKYQADRKKMKKKIFFCVHCILSRLKFLVQNLSSHVLNTTFVILLEQLGKLWLKFCEAKNYISLFFYIHRDFSSLFGKIRRIHFAFFLLFRQEVTFDFFSFLKHYFFLFLKSFPKHRLERFLRLLMHIYT